MMRRSVCLALAVALAVPVAAQSPAPIAVTPDAIRWMPAPMPGVEVAMLAGDLAKPGVYVMRVRMQAGARIPPHFHPDERTTTVLSGELSFGFGETFDERAMKTYPAGSFYSAPARMPHFLQARSGEVIYQEAGYGPSANLFPGKP